MTLTYQQQYVLDGLAARAAILNLNARYNRMFSSGDLPGWLSTFRHSGAAYSRDGQPWVLTASCSAAWMPRVSSPWPQRCPTT